MRWIERNGDASLSQGTRQPSTIEEVDTGDKNASDSEGHGTGVDHSGECSLERLEEGMNSSQNQLDQTQVEPGEIIINGRTYAQSMDAHQAMICALGTGLDRKAERSELRNEMKSLHSRYYPHDFKKPAASAPHRTSTGQSTTTRRRNHEVEEDMPAPKKKKSNRSTSLGSGLVTQKSHTVKSSAPTPMQPPKQKTGGNNNQGSVIPNTKPADILQTPSPVTKGPAPSKIHTDPSTAGKTPARLPQTFISPLSQPAQTSARKTPASSQTQAMTSSSSEARYHQQSPGLSSSSTSSVDDDQPSYEEEDDDEDDYEDKRRKNKATQHRRPSAKPANKTSSAKRGQNKKNGSWSEGEYKALWRLLLARRDLESSNENLDILKDERLMQHMSLQLAEEGIFRSKNACKNFWNRYGREWSKFEERVGGVSNRSLTTSAQTKRK
jgi:hypothetical protein